PKTVTGIPGEPVGEKDWPDVPGYTPNPGQDPKIPDTPNTPTVINYTPDTQKAVVEYVDENGNKIIADQPIEGKTDEQVDHTQVVPGIQEAINQGYNLVTDGTLNAYFDNDDNTDQVFKVVLTPVVPIEITTPVTPVGPDGNPIPGITPKTVTGIPGQPITSKDWPDVPGYTVEPGQNPKIPNTPNTPTDLVYVPNTPTESTTPSTPTPENDTPNDQTPNQPEQPTAVKENTPTPVSETQPGTPVQPIASTPQSSQVVNHRVDQPTSVAESNNGKLPQTGDEQNSLLASIGLAMFSALSMFGLAGRKRRHD
ncbi:mucin-binding protein, partial [Paucilactobacillus suebicus]